MRASHRKICGAVSSRLLSARPSSIPIGRPRGAKAAGLRFERFVAKKLQETYPNSGISYHPWYEYLDVNGRGYCQPDFVVYSISRDAYVVVECKLGNYEQAVAQMKELYFPVLRAAAGKEVTGIAVLRHLNPEIDTGRVFPSFREALRASLYCNFVPIWHYIGRGPI